ncbi:MFS transporter [Vagococcus silagei]|uniref:MFS transporter n=1 Tax=Vagococcus silagei TaxID=2508885 RepID=A0A4S3B7K4_9ENTE|nr:MFS transporter [Vagococcus silagei]THB60715.1 MFS transporter [Vagococcus silagei]
MNQYRKNKGYRALFNATMLTAIGNSLFNIVFIVYASQQPFNKLAITLASMTMFIPAFLDPWVGHLADQTIRKHKWMVYSRILQGLLFVLLASIVMLPSSMMLFLILLVINVASDCLGEYGNGLCLAYFQAMIPTEEVDGVMGFQMSARTMVQLIFQGIAGWAIVQMNYQYSLFGLINACFFFAAAFVVFVHQKDFYLNKGVAEDAQANDAEIEKLSFKESLRFTGKLINKNFALKLLLIVALFFNLLGSSFGSLLNISLLTLSNMWIQNFAQTISLVSVFISVGVLVGSFTINGLFKNWEPHRIIMLALVVMMCFPINILFIQSRVLLFANVLLSGYLMGKINPRISAMMIKIIPQDKLAISSGIFQLIVLIGGPIGQVIFLGSANLFSSTISWAIYLIMTVMILIAMKRTETLNERKMLKAINSSPQS